MCEVGRCPVWLKLFQVCIKYNSKQLKWKIEDQEEVQSGALNLFNEHLSLLTIPDTQTLLLTPTLAYMYLPMILSDI